VVPQGADVVDVDDGAGTDDGDPVGHVLDLGEHVRRHEHGGTRVAGLEAEVEELALQQRVQPAGRLVEDQQVGTGA
jgi:hypothetical protein